MPLNIKLVKNKRLTAVSLFAGCGGFDLGLKNAGYEIVWANDIDPDACATYRRNIGEIVQGDITKIPIPKLKDVSILTAGFPCQPFSSAGNREGVEDPRGKLFETTLKFVKEIRPRAVIFENVRGLLKATIDGRPLIDEICSRLKKLGYYTRYHLINFLHLGVPQHRVRVVLIAIKDQKYMAGVFPQAQAHDKLTIQNTLRGLRKSDINNNEVKKLSPQALRLGMLVPEGGSWKDVSFSDLPPRLKKIRMNMKAYKSPRFYRRCSRNDVMSTVTAVFNPEMAAVWHPTKNRIFTVREVARFQSFPDNFEFLGRTVSSKYTQIGNAVPPRIGLIFGEQLKTYLLSLPVKNVLEKNILCSDLAPNKIFPADALKFAS